MKNTNRRYYENYFEDAMPPRPPHERICGLGGPVPPHLRRPIDFDDEDWEILETAKDLTFQDEASIGAADIIQERAPQEIQILIYQISRMIAMAADSLNDETEASAENTETDSAEDYLRPYKFSIIDHDAQKLYYELYGEKAKEFINALLPVPDEIAMASRLAACLEKMMLSMKKGA